MTQVPRFIYSLLLLCGLLAAIPLVTSNRYILDLLILFCVWAGVVSQWNLLMGQAGVFSLAQMAIFSIGGYFTAVLGTHLGVPPALSIIPAGVFCAALGFLIGLPCLRLKGAYVSLLTLAAHYVIYLLIQADTSGLTGGSYGLFGFGDFGFKTLLGGRNEIIGNYYLSIVILLCLTAAAYFLSRSPLGLALQALRDSETYAESRGISRYRYQLLVFAVTSFFIGIAGSFYGTHLKLVDPTGFEFSLTMMMLAMMVIGGQSHRWGPVLGCGLVILLNEAMRGAPEWRSVVIAGVTIFVLILWPLGVAGGLERLLSRLPGRKAKP